MKCDAQLGSGWVVAYPRRVDRHACGAQLGCTSNSNSQKSRQIGSYIAGHGDCTPSPARPRRVVLPVRDEAGAGAHDDQAGRGGSKARAEPRRTVGPASRHCPSIANLNEAHVLTEKVWESHSWVSDLCRCEAPAQVASRARPVLLRSV